MGSPPPLLDRIDGRRILSRARELAFPRYPGTEGDRRAIELVGGWLRDCGLAVENEEIGYDLGPAWRALRAVMVSSAVLLATAGLAVQEQPVLGATALAVALLVGGLPLVWAPFAERLYRREGGVVTANVVARARPRARPRLRLVVLAHHDSKSQNLSLPVRLGATLTAIGGTAVVLVLVARALAGHDVQPGAAIAGGVAACALLVLSTLHNGNTSPGGVDNAGSVAVLVELARLLPPELPGDIDLWFLSPGAEEDHMVGAMRWLDRHRDELAEAPVLALNFDGLGNPGRIALLERYGLGRRFSARLSELARTCAGELGLEVRGVLLPPAMGIDTIPFAHRGIDSITVSSGSLNRATLSVHTARDRPEHLSAPTLEQGARLGAAMVLALAAGGASQRADGGESGAGRR